MHMPKGPNGQKRPGDVIGAAIMVSRIATGEIEDNPTAPDKPHHSRGGKKGAAARCCAHPRTAVRNREEGGGEALGRRIGFA